MSKHFRTPPIQVEPEVLETSWGDYAPGELDKNGYCTNPECRQPGNRWYGFCMRCEEA